MTEDKFDACKTENNSRCGNCRHKHAIRAVFRAAALLSLLTLCGVYRYLRTAAEALDAPPVRRWSETGRALAGVFPAKVEPAWCVIWYVAAILYLFLAIAVVCDEFFVPALEVMADAEHLNLSADVAGATLMAAGGSAPELFTSVIGTFKESEIGFGECQGKVYHCCSQRVFAPATEGSGDVFREVH